MVDVVITYAVETLGDLLIQEAQLLSGVRDEVEKLQKELTTLKSFLIDADRKQGDDELVRTCVAEIRNAIFQVENVLEDFVLKIDKSKRSIKKRLTSWIFKAPRLHKIGMRVKKIRENIIRLNKSLQDYGVTSRLTEIGESSNSSSEQQKQKELLRTYSFVDESNVVVGLEKDTRDLVEELLKEQTRVVFISGIGGLGKTTLARKVYQHEDVRSEFKAFAWVYVSQQFNTKDVWKQILVALSSPDNERRQVIEIMNESELARELRSIQDQNRCLVVLDDIWSGEAWKRLTVGAFPNQNTTKGSKIIVTSRIQKVTKDIKWQLFHHKPQLLKEHESWELFQRTMRSAGNGNEDCKDFENDPRMIKLGEEMVGYCQGLPLAITVLGRLLAKSSANAWEKLCNNIGQHVLIGEGEEKDDYSRVLNVLSLSYDHLPYHLKSCFLHLSNFPEDYEIDTWRLIGMWIAEGFITPNDGGGAGPGMKTIEEVAYDYLAELVDRHMVQVQVQDQIGRIISCRMHDLMRETCIEKAKGESFIHIIDGRCGVAADSSSWPQMMPNSITEIERARRLAVTLCGDCNGLVALINRRNNLLVRSFLLLPSTADSELTTEMVSYIFKNFKFLRCLDFSEMEEFPMRKLPKEIGGCVHLRFLNFAGSNINEFPSSLGNLVFLQYLYLNVFANEEEPDLYPRVPNVIWKLSHLRHLILPWKLRDGNEKLRLDGLTNLQMLRYFNAEANYFNLEDLFKLSNLRDLSLYGGSLLEFGRICKDTNFTFKYLQTLEFNQGDKEAYVDLRQVLPACPQLEELHVYMVATDGLPPLEVFPKNCKKVSFWGCQFREDPMPTLEKLPYLKHLDMGPRSYSGKEFVCCKNGFARLTSLRLFSLENLEEWEVEEGGMPKLEFLKIDSCKKLRAIPEGLRSITTLRELNIRNSTLDFKEKHEEGGEYFYRVEHVPLRSVWTSDQRG